MLLYRGVSKELDILNKGKLIPRGEKPELAAKHDGRIKHDGTFTYGITEENAVNAHHIETGLYDGCYISTTKNETTAIQFATKMYSKHGLVVLDSSLFSKYGIVSIKSNKPLYPGERKFLFAPKTVEVFRKKLL